MRRFHLAPLMFTAAFALMAGQAEAADVGARARRAAPHLGDHHAKANDCFPDAVFPVGHAPHGAGAARPNGHGGRALVLKDAEAPRPPDAAGTRRVWQVTRDGWGRVMGCWVSVPLDIVTHEHGVMLQLTLDGYRGPPLIPGSLARSELARPGYTDHQLYPPTYGSEQLSNRLRPVVVDPRASSWQRQFFPY